MKFANGQDVETKVWVMFPNPGNRSQILAGEVIGESANATAPSIDVQMSTIAMGLTTWSMPPGECYPVAAALPLMAKLPSAVSELCGEIEKLPASEQQTKVSLLASNLLK